MPGGISHHKCTIDYVSFVGTANRKRSHTALYNLGLAELATGNLMVVQEVIEVLLRGLRAIPTSHANAYV
jgi:hypothetical protein